MERLLCVCCLRGLLATIIKENPRMPLKLWRSLLACLVVMAGSVGSGVAGAQAVDKPNVVLILCDDMGWGDLPCYGNAQFKTPTIDRLAKEGARLKQFTSCCPEGTGSRVALHTGRYPFRTGLTVSPNPEDPIANQLGLPESEVTLGKLFHEAGYRTACVGKWYLGHQPKFLPLRNGYDYFYGLLYNNDMHPVELYDGKRLLRRLVPQQLLTTQYTEYAVDFIEQNKQQPFFLYMAHTMLHRPLAASNNFFHRTGTGLYGDVMAELDWSTAQILDKIKALGLDEKTIVIFTSDNGPSFGGSTGGLRGMKGMTWEGGLRVPLIVRWPGKIPAGHESDQPAVMPDLFPTILNAVGIKLPQDRVLDGLDIMPLLTSDARSPHEAIFSFRGDQLCTMRSGKWKLHGPESGPRVFKVMNASDIWRDPHRPDGMRFIAPAEQYHPSKFPGVATGFETEGVALCDMELDPAEQKDMSKEVPGVVKQMQEQFDKMAQEMHKLSPDKEPTEGKSPAPTDAKDPKAAR